MGTVTGISWCDHTGKLIRRRENIALITSISDQQTADLFAPEILACRDLCPVIGFSAEPLLGRVDLSEWIYIDTKVEHDGDGNNQEISIGRQIDWIIIGVESNGPRVGRLGEFKSEADWCDGAADLVRQCRDAGVAVYVKQIPVNGRVEHDVAKFPPELRYQEFPWSKAGQPAGGGA